MARLPEPVKIQNARLEVLRGDVSDPDSISRAIAGADAGVSAIGNGRAKETTRFYSEAITNIIAAMTKAKARRLICAACGVAY